MTDLGPEDLPGFEPEGGFLGAVTRSLLDDRVWTAHIPHTDIATSERHAGGLHAVKDYVQKWNADRGLNGYWVKDGPDAWELHEIGTVPPGS